MGIFIIIIQVSIMASLSFLPLLFILRLLIALKNKKQLKERLLIVLIPFSFGYYYFLKKEEQKKYYSIVLMIFIIVTLIGISFTLFQHLFKDYEMFI